MIPDSNPPWFLGGDWHGGGVARTLDLTRRDNGNIAAGDILKLRWMLEMRFWLMFFCSKKGDP